MLLFLLVFPPGVYFSYHPVITLPLLLPPCQLPPPSSSCWGQSRTTTGASRSAWQGTPSLSCSGTTRMCLSRSRTTSTPRSTSPLRARTMAACSWSTPRTFTMACIGWWQRMNTAGMRRRSLPSSSTHLKQVWIRSLFTGVHVLRGQLISSASFCLWSWLLIQICFLFSRRPNLRL